MKKILSIAMLCAANTGNAVVTDINSTEQFKNATESSNAIVKFSAEWCGPCKTSAKPFENLSNDAEFQGVKFLHADVDVNKQLADEYGIQGIPTFVYIHNGKEVTRHSGNLNVADAKLNLRKSFGSAAEQPAPAKHVEAAHAQVAPEAAPQAHEAQAGSWWDSLVNSIQENITWLKNSIASLFSRS